MRLRPVIAATCVVALALAAGQAVSADAPTTAKGTGTLTGHINDPYGKPAGKCTIALTSKAKKTDAPATQPGKKKSKAAAVAGPTGVTDDNGDFKITGIPAGEYTVSAMKINIGKAYASLTIGEGQTVDVKMQLGKAKKKAPLPGTT